MHSSPNGAARRIEATIARVVSDLPPPRSDRLVRLLVEALEEGGLGLSDDRMERIARNAQANFDPIDGTCRLRCRYEIRNVHHGTRISIAQIGRQDIETADEGATILIDAALGLRRYGEAWWPT